MAELTFCANGSGPDDFLMVTIDNDFCGSVCVDVGGRTVKFSKQEFFDLFENANKAFSAIEGIGF